MCHSLSASIYPFPPRQVILTSSPYFIIYLAVFIYLILPYFIYHLSKSPFVPHEDQLNLVVLFIHNFCYLYIFQFFPHSPVYNRFSILSPVYNIFVLFIHSAFSTSVNICVFFHHHPISFIIYLCT